METILTDLRYSFRRLRNSPAFSAIVILTLALGIGANTAIFSVVNAVLLRPLPYREPERLVTIEHFYPSLNRLQAPVSIPGFGEYRDKTKSFESVAVQSGWAPNLTGQGDPERLQGQRVSGLWFRVLGVAPLHGRALLPEEAEPGKEKVVVLSYGLWQRLYGGETSAIGKTMQLNGEPYQIVGVMPEDFRAFFGRNSQLFAPLAFRPEQYSYASGNNEFLSLTARLKPGVTLAQAKAEMSNFAARLKREYVDSWPTDWTLTVTPLSEEATGDIRPALLVLLGAVGFVLLIACANVANLLLARGAARMKEVAIRTALGAKRAQLVRQLLTESVLLAFVGGALGLLLAYGGVRMLVKLNPTNLPRADEIGIDASVMAFTLFVSLLTGLVFGLAPALQTSKANLQETLKEGGRSASSDRGGHAVRRVLVVAEVALALTLLTGAGLLIRSFARLQGVTPGFDASNLLTFNLALPGSRYSSDTATIAFFDQTLPAVAAVPGVKAVGATSVLPFGGGWSTGSFRIEGVQTAADQQGPWGDIRVISPDFFKTLGVPLLKGRTFTAQDREGAPLVAVVDEELAQRYWKNVEPVGKRITFSGETDSVQTWIEVVGVVGHTKHEGLDADARIQLYLPYPQAGTGFMSIAVRTAGDPLQVVNSVRAAVHSVDRDLPISNINTMDKLLEQSVGQRRLSMLLLMLFAAIALTLASIGIYGVMSYSVTQRSHELGVRMALGAARSNVLALVVRQGMTLALIGVGIGLLGAFALTRLIASQLYSIRPTDPLTFGIVALLLTGIALIATFVPALRATRVDPVVALRQE